MVDAKIQHHMLKLLKSQNSEVAEGTCWLVAELLGHDLTAPAILELKQLMFLSQRVIVPFAVNHWIISCRKPDVETPHSRSPYRWYVLLGQETCASRK
jgi:hypothetical protein